MRGYFAGALAVVGGARSHMGPLLDRMKFQLPSTAYHVEINDDEVVQAVRDERMVREALALCSEDAARVLRAAYGEIPAEASRELGARDAFESRELASVAVLAVEPELEAAYQTAAAKANDARGAVGRQIGMIDDGTWHARTKSGAGDDETGQAAYKWLMGLENDTIGHGLRDLAEAGQEARRVQSAWGYLKELRAQSKAKVEGSKRPRYPEAKTEIERRRTSAKLALMRAKTEYREALWTVRRAVRDERLRRFAKSVGVI